MIYYFNLDASICDKNAKNIVNVCRVKIELILRPLNLNGLILP